MQSGGSSAVAAQLPQPTDAPTQTPEELDRYEQIARISPKAAILEMRASVDEAIDRYAAVFAPSPLKEPAITKIRRLSKNNAINSETSALLDDVRATRVFAVEDPKLMYFLRNLLWSKFVREVGFISVEFRSKYDFAVSFAGEQRSLVRAVTESLQEHELEVFFDEDQQHLILASDVEQYLAPIYRSEARFVIAFLSREYPKKIWTKFESDNFKERFGEGSVIPIWFADAPPGVFDESARVGGFFYDSANDQEQQVARITDSLVKRAAAERSEEESASRARNAVPDEGDDA